MSAPDTDLARVRPWAHVIDECCTLTGEDPWRIAALGLRESGWGWARGYAPKGDPCGWGDHGHAFGFLQIDKRWHRDFVGSVRAQDPFQQALYACSILRDARRWFVQSSLNTQDRDHLERMVYAAYNAGPARIRDHVVLGHSPDAGTTGGDYSAWIWRKADELRAAEPGLFGRAGP